MFEKIRKEINIAKILLEIFSIIFAVLLALAVNEWRANRANEELAEKALTNIIEEMKENKKTLEVILPSHQSLSDTLKTLKQIAEKENNIDKIKTDNISFIPAFLKSTAWETALATQAFIHIDYEKAKVISEVYTAQEAYKNLNNYFIQSTFNIDNHDVNKGKVIINYGISSSQMFLIFEKELVENVYAEALEKLEEK